MFSPTHHRGRHGRLGLALLCLASFAFAAPPAIDFSMRPEGDESLSTSDGTVTLSWESKADSAVVQLQQGDSPEFLDSEMRYEGADPGSVLTGLPEGTHFFRIRLVDQAGEAGPWSPALGATVQFMDRGQLFWLLGLGGVVVVMTAGAIIAGVTRPEPKHKIETETEVSS